MMCMETTDFRKVQVCVTCATSILFVLRYPLQLSKVVNFNQDVMKNSYGTVGYFF